MVRTPRLEQRSNKAPAFPEQHEVVAAIVYFAEVASFAFVGRPVLRLGTRSSAARNSLSFMAFNALIPARNTALLLVGRARFAVLSFRDSSTMYSALGIVKLSRTSLGFGFDLSTFLDDSAGTALVTALPAEPSVVICRASAAH